MKNAFAYLPEERPRLYAARGTGTDKCDVCGKEILRGDHQYDIECSTFIVRLDRACFAEWWQHEIEAPQVQRSRSA
jgi:hypothetical protein